MTKEIHQPLQQFKLRIESSFTVGEKDETGRPCATLRMQFTCTGIESTPGIANISAETKVTCDELADKTHLFAWVNNINAYFERVLPRRIVDVAYETMIEAEYLARAKRFGRVIDKKELREWVVKRQREKFNERWYMPKSSIQKETRADFIARLRRALAELNEAYNFKAKNIEPTAEDVSAFMGCDVSNIYKRMKKHQIPSWKTALHLGLWFVD
jgi:hypothetical protein